MRIIHGGYWSPKTGKKKRPFVATRSLKNGTVYGEKVEGAGERFQLTAARMLAVDQDGRALHYDFVAYTERRYKTFAYFAGDDGKNAVLVLPEWHPCRPVRFPLSLVPAAARFEGSWMTCTADMGQWTGGALNVADLKPCADPGAELVHRPFLLEKDQSPARVVPEFGRGCGDIVLELTAGDEHRVRGGLLDLFVGVRVALPAGSRVYLAEANQTQITTYLHVDHVESNPRGQYVRCRPERQRLAHAVDVDDHRVQGHWRWRWWPRALDEHGAGDPGQFRYEPMRDTDDYPLLHKPNPAAPLAAGGRPSH